MQLMQASQTLAAGSYGSLQLDALPCPRLPCPASVCPAWLIDTGYNVFVSIITLPSIITMPHNPHLLTARQNEELGHVFA